MGAAGTLWALDYLARVGAAPARLDAPALIERIAEAYQRAPDSGEVVPSYYLGEVGIDLVRWRLTRRPEVADALWSAIERNIPNPTNEALWAAPGTMVGAWHMHRWTGEPRWRELFLANVDRLWQTWQPSDHADGPLWTQDLYGSVVQLLGAGHGFAGNVYPLLRGAALLTAEQRGQLYARCLQTLRATAVIDGEGANWPQGVGPPRPGRTQMLVQWCHGAPGIVTSLADYPLQHSLALDTLLLQAGHTVWQAGPLAKGFGLCHGTAGNGYAFLALHRRSGDAVWLQRARAFAMHALAQSEQMHAQYGRRRHTLWTGDAGLAVYLWHCVVGSGSLPGLDLLDEGSVTGWARPLAAS
jgi:hypothetical protein